MKSGAKAVMSEVANPLSYILPGFNPILSDYNFMKKVGMILPKKKHKRRTLNRKYSIINFRNAKRIGNLKNRP